MDGVVLTMLHHKKDSDSEDEEQEETDSRVNRTETLPIKHPSSAQPQDSEHVADLSDPDPAGRDTAVKSDRTLPTPRMGVEMVEISVSPERQPKSLQRTLSEQVGDHTHVPRQVARKVLDDCGQDVQQWPEWLRRGPETQSLQALIVADQSYNREMRTENMKDAQEVLTGGWPDPY